MKLHASLVETVENPVGASLLAKAPNQSTSMLNVQPTSRASSLPQGIVVFILAGVFSLALSGCMVGPDYHKPAIELPMTFKEGSQWQRAAANPQVRWTASGGWP